MRFSCNKKNQQIKQQKLSFVSYTFGWDGSVVWFLSLHQFSLGQGVLGGAVMKEVSPPQEVLVTIAAGPGLNTLQPLYFQQVQDLQPLRGSLCLPEQVLPYSHMAVVRSHKASQREQNMSDNRYRSAASHSATDIYSVLNTVTITVSYKINSHSILHFK